MAAVAWGRVADPRIAATTRKVALNLSNFVVFRPLRGLRPLRGFPSPRGQQNARINQIQYVTFHITPSRVGNILDKGHFNWRNTVFGFRYANYRKIFVWFFLTHFVFGDLFWVVLQNQLLLQEKIFGCHLFSVIVGHVIFGVPNEFW